jgi:hypothetical protein
MELPADIAAAVQKLCQNKEFAENIATFTKTAFCSLLNIPEEEEAVCPSTYLFAINYLLTNRQKFESLLPFLPTEIHKDFMKVCTYYQKIVKSFLYRLTDKRFLMR